MGRPFKFPVVERQEIVDLICERLSSGVPLAEICRQPGLPSHDSVWRWGQQSEDIARSIARARELGEEAIAAEALRIADGAVPDANGECDPTRDKLRVDTRLKLLAKWNPGRWGDRVQLRHANADGDKIDTTPLVDELLGLLAPGAGGPLSA